MQSISIPVSIGELYDKITILQIKHEKTTDPFKLEKINKELGYLKQAMLDIETFPCEEAELFEKLKKVNKEIWDIEESIREKEYKKEFDEAFIELARKVYKTNDERSRIKNEINTIFLSELMDIKIYQKYE
jgi:uncharacterized coiled-coil DUF342 family protein